MFTQSEENYIKAIYHLGANSEKGISTNSIAKKLATKASSVTDMVKKLSDKKAVQAYQYRLRGNILESENKLEDQIYEVEKLNSNKPANAYANWQYNYVVSEPIYSPNFLFNSNYDEGWEKLKVHQSKLIKVVATSLIKTIKIE